MLALHTAYLASVVFGLFEVGQQLTLALVAYLAYVVNAAQFLWKFRLARRQSAPEIERLQAVAES